MNLRLMIPALLLLSTAGIAAAQSLDPVPEDEVETILPVDHVDAQKSGESSQDPQIATGGQSGIRTKYHSGFEPPKQDDEMSRRLDKLIAELNQLTPTERREEAPAEALETIEPESKEMPDPETDDEEQAAPQKSEIPQPDPVMDSGLLKRLQEGVPESVVDTIGLADSLYQAGYHEEAYKIYQSQLAKTDVAVQKAWLMYQMANCSRKANPTEALKQYRQLLAEFPESPWCRYAEIQVKVLQWNVDHQPQRLLETIREDLDEVAAGTKKAESTALSRRTDVGEPVAGGSAPGEVEASSPSPQAPPSFEQETTEP